MSEAVEQIRLIDKEHLPDELAEFEGLGLNDRNELVGFDEEGNAKRIRGVGALLIELAHKADVAEVIDESEPEEVAELKARITELEERLAKAESENKNRDEDLNDPEKLPSNLKRMIEAIVEERTATLNQRIESLESDKDKLKDIADELRDQNDELVRKNNLLVADVASLKQQIEEADESKNQPADFKGGDEVNIVSDGQIIKGRIASEEPEWDPAKKAWLYEVAIDHKMVKANANELKAWQDLELPSGNPEIIDASENRWNKGWVKSRAKLGNWLTGRSAMASYQTYQGDRLYRTDEQEYYTDEDVRAGSIGAAALVGAGVAGGVIAYLIWGRHTGHTVTVPGPTRTVTETVTTPAPHLPAHLPQGFAVGRHLDFIGPASGHHLSAVELPGNLHPQVVSGHYEIWNNHNQAVVSHNDLQRGFMDRQGNLSKKARAILKAKGYILRQGWFGKRYMTEVYKP